MPPDPATALTIRRYRDLAKTFGLSFRFTEYKTDHTWLGNGCIQIPRWATHAMSHELGHYLVATPAQRRMVEFGLGSSPWANETTQAEVNFDVASDIEGRASLLGIFIQKHLETRRGAANTFFDHNWDWFSGIAVACELQAAGLLLRHNGVLTPRCLVRPPRKSEVFR